MESAKRKKISLRFHKQCTGIVYCDLFSSSLFCTLLVQMTHFFSLSLKEPS